MNKKNYYKINRIIRSNQQFMLLCEVNMKIIFIRLILMQVITLGY